MDKELTPTQARMLDVLESRRFWMIFVVFALILLGVGAGKYYLSESQKKSERMASEKLFEAEKLESEGLGAQATIFTQEFFKKRLEWTADKKEKINKILSELVAQYPATAAAQSARLHLGVQAFLDAKYDEALRFFEQNLEKAKRVPENITLWSSFLGKATTLEMQKKPAEALAVYDEIAKDNNNPLVGEALLGKVRVLSGMGRQTEAEPIVKKLKEDFAGSYYESAARALEAYQAR